MDETPFSDDDLVARLQHLGESPVDAQLTARVLGRARAARPAWWRSTKLKVGAGVTAGFLAGSVGLASAGTLPAPAQDVAHNVLGAVGIGVPPGQSRYNGPECGGTYRNHGQYVRAHKGDPGAGSSPCGRPDVSVNPGSSTTEAPGSGPGSHGHGPPPWAHGGKGDSGASSTPGSDAPDDSVPATTLPAGAATTTSTSTTTEPTTVPGTTSTTTS